MILLLLLLLMLLGRMGGASGTFRRVNETTVGYTRCSYKQKGERGGCEKKKIQKKEKR